MEFINGPNKAALLYVRVLDALIEKIRASYPGARKFWKDQRRSIDKAILLTIVFGVM